MNIRQLLLSGLISIAVTVIGCASQAQSSNALSEPPPDVPATAQSAAPNPDPWPRSFTQTDATVRVYQPQVEKWEGNRLDLQNPNPFVKFGSKTMLCSL